jgi:Rho termination factor-like protein
MEVEIMVQKKAGTGVKKSAKKSRKKASQRGGVSSFDNLKVPELKRRAKKAGIKGRSTMKKKQLVKALRAA